MFEKVGFPCKVNDALDSLKRRAKYVSRLNEGYGAIRDIIEFILCENEFSIFE
ncbi:MAG: hypothetical protein K2H37_13060 [Lachnospiraceae bacterium]|nr:hypothetical protein [Lachnospiraceae bacterium]